MGGNHGYRDEEGDGKEVQMVIAGWRKHRDGGNGIVACDGTEIPRPIPCLMAFYHPVHYRATASKKNICM